MGGLCARCKDGKSGLADDLPEDFVQGRVALTELEAWEREALLQDIAEHNTLDAYWLFRDGELAVRADKQIALAAMKKDGDSLQHAADTLKADKSVVLAAVMKNGRALEHAADALKADKSVVLAAVTKNGYAFRDAADTLKANKDFVVRAVVAGDGYALQFATDTLKANKEVVLAAVTQNGRALEWAADTMKADKDVVLEAVTKCSNAMEYASKDAPMWSDKEFVLSLVQMNGAWLKYAKDGLNQDEDLLRAAGLWDSTTCAAYSRSSWVRVRTRASLPE